MKKFFIPVIAGFIVAAFYIVSGGHSRPYNSLGAPNDMGAEEDENARYTYELTRLCDPATGKIPLHIRERELAFAAGLPNDGNLSAARTTSLSWQPRGPWNVGGRTRALAIDVSNERVLVAGSCSGGMWRSSDGGASWHPTSVDTQCKAVSCVAQDTRHGHTNVWYYGTGEADGASATGTGAYYLGNGIYKSTDSGKTWTSLPATRTNHITSLDNWGDLIWNIVTDPSDSVHDVVYAATYGAIYRSADGGSTWASVLGAFGSTNASYYSDIAISKTGVVYVTMSNGNAVGIYRSVDGINYVNITPSNFPMTYNRVKIGISPADENQVYFLGNTPNSGMPDTSYVGAVEWNSLWKYNYISGNGTGTGGLWRDFSHNLPSAGGVFDKFTCQGSYDLVVKVKPNDSNVVFIGGTNLYRSTSGFADNTHTTFAGGYQQGASLPVVNMYLNHHPDQHELVFYPSNPNRMLSGNDGGIFYCNDNTVPNILWSSLNNGYITSMFYTCAIDHASTSDIVIGGAQDNGSWFTNSTDVRMPWVTPRGGDGSFCAIADNSSAYYFSIQMGRIMKGKLDNSGNVDSFARIDPKGGRGYLFISPYALDPNNNSIMYLSAGKFLWRNNNMSGIPYAANWDSISTNWFRFPDSTLSTGTAYNPTYAISAIAVCKNPANRVYAGTTNRKLYRIDSANTATHVVHNIASNSFPGANIACVAVDPNDGNHVMVVFSNYGVYSLFYSPDGGTTWQKVAGTLEQNKTTGAGDGPSLRWASIIPVSNGTVYMVGTSAGLYATTSLNDTNTMWVQQGTNTIGYGVVDMIDYRATDGLVVVATHSGGMYSTHITQTGDITSVSQTVAANSGTDLTVYPNPFSRSATLKFTLKEPAHVNIAVYDQMGRLVRLIADEELNAGDKKYSFDRGSLPAGIYYCTLRAGIYSETKQFVVLP